MQETGAGPLIDRIAGGMITSAIGRRALAELAADHPELQGISRSPKPRALLAAIPAASPFLWSLIRQDPPRLVRLLQADPAVALDAVLDRLREETKDLGEDAAMRTMRRIRGEAALLIALADLGGVWSCEEVTGALSRFAAEASQAALAVALRSPAIAGKLRGDPEPDACGLSLIGMGKLGASELNYSSDIDLIAFYDPDRAALADGVEPATFFTRLVQRFVRILNDRTADGYVARVDLRLRPDPGSMPLAVSRLAALRYYESVGQNWERAAFIKARPIAGDMALGAAILAELTPFVWRRHLDFAAIADIHAMKRQINAHRGHALIAVEGHNIKLGRGGIREIEFFAQTQQLIAGGRNPGLRMRDTVGALRGLAEDRWITNEARDDLTEAYRFLRRVEHRLQMVEDAQTHELPADRAELRRFARFCGFGTRDAFAEALTQRLTMVQTHYERLFERAPPLAGREGSLVFTGDSDDPETLHTLAQMGFSQPDRASAIIRGWHHGRYGAMQSPRARELLTELMPGLLQAFTETGSADEALLGFDRMLEHVTAGIALLSIFRSNPDLLGLIVDILAAAPRLSAIIGRRPRVLDAVLDPGFFSELPDDAGLRRLFARALSQAKSYEDRLNRARIVGQEQQTLVGVRLISGALNAEQAGIAFSRLAAIAIDELLSAAEAELTRLHGPVKGGEAVVVGLGRLGAEEMTASSDLDLILLYRHDPHVALSCGPHPIAPQVYYARLMQRLVAALSAQTGEGVLYEVDLRLRPSGRAGPVATGLDGFLAYHRDQAWTWEHMALVRARPVAGSSELKHLASVAIRAILSAKRDAGKIAADVLEMRGLIAEEKGEDDPWNVKRAIGGLVDIEFIAQFLMLAHAHQHAALVGGSTLQVLERACRLGLLDEPDHAVLRRSARLQHEIAQVTRLCTADTFKPDDAGQALRKLLERVTSNPDFARVEVELRDLQRRTRAVFLKVLHAAGDKTTRARA